MYDSDYLKKLSEIDSIVEKPYISNEEVEPAEPEQTSDAEDKPRLFDKLKAGLSKTRKNIVYGIDTVFGAYDDLDDEFFEDLEEQLIIADV